MFSKWRSHLYDAVYRARTPILFIALTYLLAVILGIAMATLGNGFALRFRDKLISDANRNSPITKSLNSGNRVQAALLDFGANLFLGAVPNTVGGLAIVPPFPVAAFRGWVGGVVSVDSKHRSRLADPHEAAYYLCVLLLQLIPYSLAGGAGVRLGIETYRDWNNRAKTKWWFVPQAAALDVLFIYSLVIPMFLVASLVEFLAR